MLLRNLRDEIDATLARDPAARSRLEVVLCYPGFHALLFHCLAHWLWQHRWLLAGRFVSHLGRMLTGIEIHPGARIGVDLDARQHPPEMRHETAGEQPTMLPKPMGEAVEQERVEARITQHDFEARTGGGISGEGSVDFVAQVSKEHRCHYIVLALMPRMTAPHRGRREQTYNCPTKMIKNCGTPSCTRVPGVQAVRWDLSWIGRAGRD